MSDELAQREMTLAEWVDRLPAHHGARLEFADLTALRERHAAAVEAAWNEAYGEGWDADGTPRTFTQQRAAAWAASTAKARLT